MKLSPFKRKTLSSLLPPLFIMALFAWTGCEKDYNYVAPAKTTPTNPGGGGGGNTVNFATDIQPIFDAYCTSCHDGATDSPNLTSGNSYSAIITGTGTDGRKYVDSGNPANSDIYYRVTLPSTSNNFMPSGGGTPLTSAEAAKILTWITEGATNN